MQKFHDTEKTKRIFNNLIGNISKHTCVRFNSKTLSTLCLAKLTAGFGICSGLSDTLGSLITMERGKRNISIFNLESTILYIVVVFVQLEVVNVCFQWV